MDVGQHPNPGRDSKLHVLCRDKMVVGGSQQETLDPGFMLLDTRQQGVPVILTELMLPSEFKKIRHCEYI
ncbi:unnamed protein product [Schistosoma curassoni]|uniref:DNA-directed RNA polymerase n=1 Tax=Schistosoma curassoni TaxID=6186 RepID=A0A183L5L3_9TREM|nr:unnamed protein product [Schistosoma curassoni]